MSRHICLPSVYSVRLLDRALGQGCCLADVGEEDHGIKTRLLSIKGDLKGIYSLYSIPSKVLLERPQLRLALINRGTGYEIPMEAHIANRLRSYFEMKPSGKYIDCKQFAVDFTHTTNTELGSFYIESWDIIEFQGDDKIQSGEILGFVRNGNVFNFSEREEVTNVISHVAIKLSPDLYISKAGLYTDFYVICSLNSLKKLWDAKPVVSLLRKEDFFREFSNKNIPLMLS